MTATKTYLPELHDVHPGMAGRLDRLITAFPDAARPLIAYSVVPNWMGRHPLDAARDFAARVRDLPGEKVLHGWTHTKGPDWLNWALYGHENRSEFSGLSPEETADRLDKGLEVWRQAGLERPAWFCAPRWIPSASLDAALSARGFAGVLARTGITRFGATPLPCRPLNFDEGARAWKTVPGRWLRTGQINAMLSRSAPFRLVLHPDDLDNPATFAQFEATVARLDAEGWTPVGLDKLIGSAS